MAQSKNNQREGRLIVFVDESGISERPTRVRPWAPKEPTPTIQFHFNWNHVSVSAGLTRTNCLFCLHEGSFKNPVKYLWVWLKRHALANHCPNQPSELHATARKNRPSFAATCWMQATL